MAGEDKQLICDLLRKTLQATRGAGDVVNMEYIDEFEERGYEHVVVTFNDSGTRFINVSADSGFAMIKDIINNLGV